MFDKFCKYCGVLHTTIEIGKPQKCAACHEITWVNPTPVAAIIVPVLGRGPDDVPRTGVLVGERGITPFKGGWNLPAGFVDPSDATIEAAAARELFEETGFVVPLSMIALDHSFSDGRIVVCFCATSFVLAEESLGDFVINHECPSVRIAWGPEELCFGSHTEALRKFFG